MESEFEITNLKIKEMDDTKKGFDNIGDIKIKKRFLAGIRKT